MCAAGGRYMANSLTSSYITGQQKDYYGQKSFVEEQAVISRRYIQENTQHGDKLLQHLQGRCYSYDCIFIIADTYTPSLHIVDMVLLV